MDALDVVIIILWILLVAGGIFFLLEILKDVLDKKATEKRINALQAQFNDFQKSMSTKIAEYQESYETLRQQYESYRKESESVLKAANETIDGILDYANRITSMNQQFFDKITLISSMLNEDNPPAEEIKQLARKISNDIDEQTELQKEGERIRRKRAAAIERDRKQQLRNEQNRGQDLER